MKLYTYEEAIKLLGIMGLQVSDNISDQTLMIGLNVYTVTEFSYLRTYDHTIDCQFTYTTNIGYIAACLESEMEDGENTKVVDDYENLTRIVFMNDDNNVYKQLHFPTILLKVSPFLAVLVYKDYNNDDNQN